jgi:hypothetical protein
VRYQNQSCHLHVELIIDRGDKYLIEPEKLINCIIIGADVHVLFKHQEASCGEDDFSVHSMQGIQHYQNGNDLESISSFRASLPGSIVAIPPVPDSPNSAKEYPNSYHVTLTFKQQAVVKKATLLRT